MDCDVSLNVSSRDRQHSTGCHENVVWRMHAEFREMNHRIAVVQPAEDLVQSLICARFARPFRVLLGPEYEHEEAHDERPVCDEKHGWIPLYEWRNYGETQKEHSGDNE